MIHLNENEISFPDPEFYNPEGGLMAIGGDLSSGRLCFAYETGLFPWYNEGEEILWWCPDPRFVIYPEELKISKSMRKILKENRFTFTENVSFKEVILNCKKMQRPGQEGTWISEILMKSYIKLNELGIAKSVEVWQNEELVGGFYGVEVGNVFCGESMFAKVSNASKAGFIDFVKKYAGKYEIIDCQVHTEHLESLGARMISKKEYLKILKNNEA